MEIQQKFFNIFVPVICGIIIYAFWRGLYLIDPAEKTFPLFSVKHIPEWIKYNLPDGLGFYALLSTLVFIWDKKTSAHFLLWLLLTIILIYFSEVLQAYNLIHGTFDWNDLIAYSIAIFFFFFNFHFVSKKFSFPFKIRKNEI